MEKKMSNVFLHARLVRNRIRMNCQKMKLEQHIKIMGKVLGIEGCAEHRLQVIMLPIMPGIKTVLQSK